MAKLVTPGFVAFQNSEIKKTRKENNPAIPLPPFPVIGNNIERVEVSCDLAWAYGRTDASDLARKADTSRLIMTRLYVLKQKSPPMENCSRVVECRTRVGCQ
jgi:hypothetical protein